MLWKDQVAEFLTIDFDAGGTPTLVAAWRPENPGDAVLSVCSSLIVFDSVDVSLVVQFSHFSMKEFLTSSRLTGERISRYLLSLEPAHRLSRKRAFPFCSSLMTASKSIPSHVMLLSIGWIMPSSGTCHHVRNAP